MSVIYGNPKVVFALCCIFLAKYNGNYKRAFLETYYELMGNKDLAGIAGLGDGLTYLFNSFMLPICCGKFPRRLLFVLAFIGYGTCNIFQGPSAMLGLYDSDWSL